MPAPGKLDGQDVARVAAEANVDRRTVVRALEGRTKSKAIRAAIAAALRKCSLSAENGAALRREARTLEVGGG